MTGPWHGGKGDRPRPVNRKKWNKNYDKIFNKQKKIINPMKGIENGR